MSKKWIKGFILGGAFLSIGTLASTPSNLVTINGTSFFNDAALKNKSMNNRIDFLAKQFNKEYQDPTLPLQNKVAVFFPMIGKFKNYSMAGGIKAFSLFHQNNVKITYLELLPGEVKGANFHVGEDIFVYTLQGIALNLTGEKLQDLQATGTGEAIFIPGGVCHQAINPSTSVTLKVLEIAINKNTNKNAEEIACAQNYSEKKKNLYYDNPKNG